MAAGRPQAVHRTFPRLRLFHPTGNSAHSGPMSFEVTVGDGTAELVPGADTYTQEGPLTTFFRTDPGRRVIDCWSERLASFRTADVTRIRRLDG